MEGANKKFDLLVLGIILLIIMGINVALLATGHMNFDAAGIGLMISATLTIAIFSFLYQDNALFKFAEHLFVGAAAAYMFHMFWYDVMQREVINTLFLPPAGTSRNYWVIIPTVLGILLLGRIFKRTEVLSRIAFAFVVGFGAGQTIPNNIAGWILEQIGPTITPLFAGGSLNFDGLIILLGVLAVLIYFFFSIEHKGFIGGVSKIGIYFLMISFGASFGYTVMARMSLLIGRIGFLFKDWIPLIN